MRHNLINSVIVSLSLCAFAHATPITYKVTDTASGSIGGLSFSNQSVAVVYQGDTANVLNSGGFITDTSGVATIAIAGLGTFTFTSGNTDFFENQSGGAAGIADNSAGSILDTYNAAFSTYNGTASIGPLSGSVYYNPFYTFATTGGTLQFSSAGATSTFTASTSVTPEPSSLLLLTTGIVGVAGAMRRRIATR